MSGHTKEQIEHMVSRFLSWTLPADFSPDGGVSYTPLSSVIPTGTNLLNYPQARAMVLHMLTGLPEGDPEWEGELSAEETAKIDAAWETHKTAGYNPAALAALVEAAAPFAAIAEHDIGDDEHDSDLFQVMGKYNRAPKLKVGDFRRILSALTAFRAGEAS